MNFLCAVHAGDGDCYKLVYGKVTHCNASVFNCTARHGFHCDKADVFVSAFLQQRFALAFNNVIREHDRFNPVKLKRTFENRQRVCGDADMPDFARIACRKKCLQCAACTDYGVKLFHAWVVYLIQVDIVGAEVAEACFNVCLHCFAGACHALCCKNELVTPSVDCAADVFFADGVAACRVDIVYSAFNKGVDKRLCLFRIDALNGDAAETDAGNLKPGFAECYILHECTLRICINYCFLKLNSLRRIPCGCGFRLRYYKLFFAKKQINKSVLKKRTDGPRTLMLQCVNSATSFRIRLTLCSAGV